MSVNAMADVPVAFLIDYSVVFYMRPQSPEVSRRGDIGSPQIVT